MHSASFSIQQYRESVRRDFWNEIQMIDDGADAQTVIQHDMSALINEPEPPQLVEGTQVRVSQGGLISKIECDIIVAEDVPCDGFAFD